MTTAMSQGPGRPRNPVINQQADQIITTVSRQPLTHTNADMKALLGVTDNQYVTIWARAKERAILLGRPLLRPVWQNGWKLQVSDKWIDPKKYVGAKSELVLMKSIRTMLEHAIERVDIFATKEALPYRRRKLRQFATQMRGWHAGVEQWVDDIERQLRKYTSVNSSTP